MDALNDKVYNVYFGGRYQEEWSEDYTLSIRYENRRTVQARRVDGTWVPVGGDQQIVGADQDQGQKSRSQGSDRAPGSRFSGGRIRRGGSRGSLLGSGGGNSKDIFQHLQVNSFQSQIESIIADITGRYKRETG